LLRFALSSYYIYFKIMNKQPTEAPEKEKMLALSNTEQERIDYHRYGGDDDHDHDHDHDSDNDDKVSLSSESLKKDIKARNNCGGAGGDPRDISSSVSGPTYYDDEYWYENSQGCNNNNNNAATAAVAAAPNTSTANQDQDQHQLQRKRENMTRRRSSQMSDITFDSIAELLLSESDLDDSSHIDEELALLVTKRFGIGSANANNNNNINNNNTTIEKEGQRQRQQQQQQQQRRIQQQQQQQQYDHVQPSSYDTKRSGCTTDAVASSTTAPPTIPIRRVSKDPTILAFSSTTAPPTIPRRRVSKDPTTITTTTTLTSAAAAAVKKKVNYNKKEINSYLARRATIPRKAAAAAMAASSSSNKGKGNVESPKVPQRTRSTSDKSLLPGASFSSTSSISTTKNPIAAVVAAAVSPIAAATALGVVSSRFGSNEFISDISMEQSLLMYNRSPLSRGRGAAYTTIPTTTTKCTSSSSTAGGGGGGTFVCNSPPIVPQRRISAISIPSLSDFLEEEDSDFEEDLLDALAEEEEGREKQQLLQPSARATSSASNYKPTLPRIASIDNIQELSADISISLSSLSLSIPVQHTNTNLSYLSNQHQPPIIPIRRGSNYVVNEKINSTNSKSIIDDSLQSSCTMVGSSSLFDSISTTPTTPHKQKQINK
jgi:hypothetical protein